MDGRRHRPRGATPPKTDMALVIEAREEAKNYLKQAENTLIKARDVHDSTLTNQRKIAFALSSLIGKPVLLEEGSSAKEVLHAVTETEAQIRQRQELEVVNTIMNLAIANRDVIHIFVNFCAIINELNVQVYAVNSNYSEPGSYKFLLKVTTRLGERDEWQEGNAISELLAIEDQLIDLIAEARDKQETDSDEVAA